MLQNNVKIDRSGETIFLNVTISNPSNAKEAIPAQISSVLQRAIVDDPSQYRLIISRFSIPSQSIPLYYFQTLPYPNTNPNKGIYSVSIGYNGNYTDQVYLNFNPESFQLPQIAPYTEQNPNQSPQDSYYYAYSYSNLAAMITTAIRQAIVNASVFLPFEVDAYMVFQTSSGLFNLLGTTNMAHSNDTFDPLNVSIWFNTPLVSFFTGVRKVINTYNSANGRDALIPILDLLNNTSATQDGCNPNIPEGFYQMTSEFQSNASLEEVNRIVITSNCMGGVAAQSEVSKVNSGNYQNVIADFVPKVAETAGEYRGKFQYYAGSEFYRRTLTDKMPMNQIQLSLLWQGLTPNVYRPIMLRPEEQAELQLILEKI